MSIFKAYDIRGTVPDQFNPEMARKIANAMVQYLDAKKIVVMRDMRTHSPDIYKATIEGATDAGCDVLACGFGTTPMSYFVNGKLEYDGSIMVTASHNPAQYNGFKVCRGSAVPMSIETGIGEIQKIYESGKYLAKPTKGTVTDQDFTEDYVKHITSFAKNLKPLKVAIDSANGATGPFVQKIFQNIPCELHGIYLEPDGSFPNHEANPLKAENLVDLKKLILENQCDIGICFDGDGDRCQVLDEKGNTVGSDLMTAALAKIMLRKYPGTHVLYDLRSSWIVPETIKAEGGTPVRERVGHSFMKVTMRKLDAAFGGELSGHFYFKENYYSDSGLLAMIKIFNLLSEKEQPLSELIKPLRRYYSTGEINFTVDDQDAKISQVQESYPEGETDFLDGITVQFKDWWFNVRKSNTEPILRLNLEAKSKDLMDSKKAEIIKLIGTPE